MTVNEIREKFLTFFRQRDHKIVPAAPIVNQNDPTLMFINSGMAQFKDYFLGNETAPAPRIADTQKCLRVSGKHNDLEDVGRDGYHLTMFEMLGNWSFGDYFKKEAIAWSWELLTEVYQIPKDRLYVTVFGGDEQDGLPADEEAAQLWSAYLPQERIAYFGRKDNFWEMGDVGPCGPCTEIHVDIRPDAERAAVSGRDLVNADHPQVIEIWNNVFMEFERRADGSLRPLSKQHVDTGMGLERLCMVLQNKPSAYDTDVFQPYIKFLEEVSGLSYGASYAPEAKSDMAMRVIADHIRAISLVIADGQLPSNTGAGYVVRRILRRALRYAFSFLNIQEPILYRLLPLVAQRFEGVFDEVLAQKDFIAQVIRSEEEAFLRTLANGLRRFEELQGPHIQGQTAFELYDTYGFPFDLTAVLAAERGWTMDEAGFLQALDNQKERSRKDAEKSLSDWQIVLAEDKVDFVGYDQDQSQARLLRYRKVLAKGKESYQLVLDATPFYPEGGGQVGDVGKLYFDQELIEVVDTKKENNLIIHWTNRLPQNPQALVRAEIDAPARRLTEANHSATHLLHAALRQILGSHVQQKGSLVRPEALRFDFSHFQKLSTEELQAVENLVNAQIRANHQLEEARNLPLAQAQAAGAMMLFGEKYGEQVRMITLGQTYSRELCGGCHVRATGAIGYFKIIEETSIASGVRRITAYTGQAALDYVQTQMNLLTGIRERFKNPKDLLRALEDLQQSERNLLKQVEQLERLRALALQGELLAKREDLGRFERVIAQVDLSKEGIKELCNQLNQTHPRLVLALAQVEADKPSLTIAMPKALSAELNFNAGVLVKQAAAHIRGGGGGQAFFATAGGSDVSGLNKALETLQNLLK